MPTDVLHEVFSSLTVRDLWMLTRVNPFLREMIRAPACLYLWQEASEREGMPEPGPDMTVYQQATLLYEKKCSACGKVAGKADFGIRMRLCTKCKPKVCVFVLVYRESQLMICTASSARVNS